MKSLIKIISVLAFGIIVSPFLSLVSNLSRLILIQENIDNQQNVEIQESVEIQEGKVDKEYQEYQEGKEGKEYIDYQESQESQENQKQEQRENEYQEPLNQNQVKSTIENHDIVNENQNLKEIVHDLIEDLYKKDDELLIYKKNQEKLMAEASENRNEISSLKRELAQQKENPIISSSTQGINYQHQHQHQYENQPQQQSIQNKSSTLESEFNQNNVYNLEQEKYEHISNRSNTTPTSNQPSKSTYQPPTSPPPPFDIIKSLATPSMSRKIPNNNSTNTIIIKNISPIEFFLKNKRVNKVPIIGHFSKYGECSLTQINNSGSSLTISIEFKNVYDARTALLDSKSRVINIGGKELQVNVSPHSDGGSLLDNQAGSVTHA